MRQLSLLGLLISLVLFSCSGVNEGAPVDSAIQGSRNTVPGSLNLGCDKEAICDGEPVTGDGSLCVFARLSHSRPAFAISLNPIIREETQHFPGFFQSAFEGQCNLYTPLLDEVKQQLNVTGWEEVALMVAVEEPMDRLVASWADMVQRAAQQGAANHEGKDLKGFTWLRDLVHDAQKDMADGDLDEEEALQVLETPEVYHRFLATYLEYIQQPHAMHWEFDDRLTPQIVNIGICSSQPFRTRVLVRPERIASDTYNFLVTHAEASMQQDAPLLKHLSSLPRTRRAEQPGLLDTGSLLHEASFSLLWDQIRHTRHIQAELVCTGYATDQEIVDQTLAPEFENDTTQSASVGSDRVDTDMPAARWSEQEGHADSVDIDTSLLSAIPPAPGKLSEKCEPLACRAHHAESALETRCVFARLGEDRPAFALSLNPKCASTALHDVLKRHENLFPALFEAPCSFYTRLPGSTRRQLKVSGWEDIALLVPVRDPMERFVSAWHEITLVSAMGLKGHDGGQLVKGFEWMLEMLLEVARLDGKRPSQTEALKMLRSPDVFRTYQYRYLGYALPSNVTSWRYATSLAPQLPHLGLCSEQSFRTRFVVPMEHLHTGIRAFLIDHAGATHEQHKPLLDAFSHFRIPQQANETELLDTNALKHERSEFKSLWARVQRSPVMRLDYVCTGYNTQIESISDDMV